MTKRERECVREYERERERERQKDRDRDRDRDRQTERQTLDTEIQISGWVSIVCNLRINNWFQLDQYWLTAVSMTMLTPTLFTPTKT